MHPCWAAKRKRFMREPVVEKTPLHVSWLCLLFVPLWMPLMLWQPEVWGYGFLAYAGLLLLANVLAALIDGRRRIKARDPASCAEKPSGAAVRYRAPAARLLSTRRR